MNGDLIGINTAIFSRTGGSGEIGFAIPSSIALDIVDSLQKTGKVVRGWMGVAIREITPGLGEILQASGSAKRRVDQRRQREWPLACRRNQAG